MDESDGTAFWALMFCQFHGLEEKDSSQFIGRILAARYGQTVPAPAIDALLARLEAVEQGSPADGGEEVPPRRQR